QRQRVLDPRDSGSLGSARCRQRGHHRLHRRRRCHGGRRRALLSWSAPAAPFSLRWEYVRRSGADGDRTWFRRRAAGELLVNELAHIRIVLIAAASAATLPIAGCNAVLGIDDPIEVYPSIGHAGGGSTQTDGAAGSSASTDAASGSASMDFGWAEWP